MMDWRSPCRVLASGMLFLAAAPNSSADESAFYRTKTVRIVVGQAPGGGFDLYARTLARHMVRHIPGNPNVIVENMPGAGSLAAANYLYNNARPDGLTLGSFLGSLVLNQVLGQSEVAFDARRFRWIGIPDEQTGACVLTKASGVTSIEKWQAATTPLVLGSTGSAGVMYTAAVVLKEALGFPVRLVTGYQGAAAVRLASDRGEVHGACWQWESIKTTWRERLADGSAVVVLQFGRKPHPDLSNVPLATRLAKSEEARLILRVAVEDLNAITRAYAAPPGTPDDRVAVLRKAFMATLKDPAFVAEAKKLNLTVRPLTSDELEERIRGYFELPQHLVNKLKVLLEG